MTFMVSPYLSAIIEQDEAPEMVKHFRGFFVGAKKSWKILAQCLLFKWWSCIY